MNDVVKRPGQWLPGQSGNPAGRPLGARHKIAEQIISTLAADWNGEDTPGVPNGPAAVARLRKEDPSRYVAAAFGLLPRDVLVSVQQEPSAFDSLSHEDRAGLLDAVKLMRATGLSLPDLIEGLRSLAAKPTLEVGGSDEAH